MCLKMHMLLNDSMDFFSFIILVGEKGFYRYVMVMANILGVAKINRFNGDGGLSPYKCRDPLSRTSLGRNVRTFCQMRNP